MRIALGLSYRGSSYRGWQSQPGGHTVQDHLEAALSTFAARPIKAVCAGRTDAGVHALNQVVHLDPEVVRESFSWVRGTNTFLPEDISVQWCRAVPDDFHARNSARGRRYVYWLLESPVRPSIEAGMCGWVFRPLDADAMRRAAAFLLGEHDFTSFRSSECQSPTPVKTLREITIEGRGAPLSRYWRFEFEGTAFLHHMIRNIMGCMVAVGTGARPADWMGEVLAARDRDAAAPTFSPHGLYFVGPRYDDRFDIPTASPVFGWLPHWSDP
jgi:tRNA pseudouridine38-40 synthase